MSEQNYFKEFVKNINQYEKIKFKLVEIENRIQNILSNGGLSDDLKTTMLNALMDSKKREQT